MTPEEAAKQASSGGFDLNPWATIAAVFLGALLTPVVEELRAAWRRKSLNRDLRLLLRSTLGTIDEKREILRKSIAALREGKALPGYHVRFQLDALRSTVTALGDALAVKDRNLMHHIIERQRVADELVESHLDRLKADVDRVRETTYAPLLSFAVGQAHADIAGMLESVDEALALTSEFIEKYLNGEVVDVCHLGEDASAERKA